MIRSKSSGVSLFLDVYKRQMYKQGGIYMDTDVEVTKNLDKFLVHQGFSGFESDTQIPTGIMAAEKGFPLFKELLSYYDGRCV